MTAALGATAGGAAIALVICIAAARWDGALWMLSLAMACGGVWLAMREEGL